LKPYFNIATIFLLLILFHNETIAQENYIEQIQGNDYKLPMQFIPSGSFKMGSPKFEQGHFGDEGPQHQVSVDGFWMGQFEITWDLYNLFVSRELDGNQISNAEDSEVNIDVDGVSGATTPYVEMSFGWE
jgi:formylglycine-generating enzyme required for sulfatase activity